MARLYSNDYPNFDAQAERIHQAIAGQPALTGQLLRVNRAQEASGGVGS